MQPVKPRPSSSLHLTCSEGARDSLSLACAALLPWLEFIGFEFGAQGGQPPKPEAEARGEGPAAI